MILLFLGVVSSWAEVKLRIYLQDGTLQAGNLVAENPDSFVILSKEGRAEIKKDKIMFINGKTLKQWEERPDKFFQTEIIPSEVPNPAYVNDKAPIPSLPQPVKAATAKPPVVEPVKPLPAAAAKNEPAKPPAVAPVSEPPPAEKVIPAQAAAATPVAKRRSKRTKRAAPEKPAPAAPVEEQAAESPALPARPVAATMVDVPRPARFVRKDFGDYHYQRAVKLLEAGDRGRAVQELHLATVLDRQNGESVLLLGKIYMQEGQRARAEKYFAHPLIKKRDDVKTWNEEMAKADMEKERSKKILYGAAAAGALAWIPLLALLRFLKKPPKRVFTAEVLEGLQSRQIEPSSEPETGFTGFKPAGKPPEPPQAQSVVPPPPVPPVLPPAPVAPAFSKPVEPVAPMAPPPVPILMIKSEPPIPPPMPPPIVVPVLSGVDPLPVVSRAESPATPPNADDLDVKSALRLAGMVDRAVRKGNALAVEEQFDLARREYRTAMALNPGCVEAYLGLGYLSFIQGQWDLALEHYVKALGIDPKSADAHYGIGRVFLEIDRVEEAVFEFQKTLALDPGFDDARETLTALGTLA